MSARKQKADAPTLDAVEVTTFRLNGCSLAEFIEANAEVDDWLQRELN